MIPHRLSTYADAAATRYQQLIDAWQIIYDRALSSPRFGYASQPAEVVREAFETAQDYLRREEDLIEAAFLEIASDAHQRAKDKIESVDANGLTDAALAHTDESQTYLREEIVSQVTRDIANLRQSLQRALLDVSMLSRLRGLPLRQAVIAWRMSADRSLSFTFQDRRAHKTPSAKFIRGLWRMTLLSIHNEVTLMTIADHGLARAAIMKVEEGVEMLTGFVSLAGDVTYGDIRAHFFHPNSNSYLDVEPADVSA